MKVTEFVSILFHSRTQSHIFHLKTTSYSVHKALDNYYNSIIPLVDKFIEAYQGKYGRIPSYSNYPLQNDPKKVVTYFKGLINKIQKFKINDSYLRNIVDEIYALLYSTMYLLTLH
jgi:hypothetical protein